MDDSGDQWVPAHYFHHDVAWPGRARQSDPEGRGVHRLQPHQLTVRFRDRKDLEVLGHDVGRPEYIGDWRPDIIFGERGHVRRWPAAGAEFAASASHGAALPVGGPISTTRQRARTSAGFRSTS